MVWLPREYQDVYETSKDVVRLKQRHLLKDVLQRLNYISLPNETIITTLTNDQVRFFFGDILSLIIDNDSTIQAEAIKALEYLLSKLEPASYQNNPEWQILRDRIVEDYTKHISKVRDSSNNANWYKIWCLLIHVLDQDIIRSVLIINKFLAIVEQSFKSPDLEVRAQAFVCWKTLVEIFFKYDELTPAKRVKLVSIPFRSSQAKNLFGAEKKLEAYWYFLVKLSESKVNNSDGSISNSLELHHELVFGSFLQFCFGSSVKGGVSTLKQFPKMKEMTVFILISMLNSNNPEIEVQLQNNNLEKPKEAIISETIMKSNWRSIIRSCFEASLIIVEQCNARKKLLEILWHGLIHHVMQAKNSEIYKELCLIIKQLIQTDKDNPEFSMKSNIQHIVEMFGTHYKYLYDINSNTANYVQIFDIITNLTDILLLSDDQYFPSETYETISKNIYAIEKYSSLTKFWDLQKDLIEYMLTSDQLNDFTNFPIKISIWRTLSMVLRNYMDAKLFEFRLQSKSEVVNKWIIWPIKKCGWLEESNVAIVHKYLDSSFFTIWRRIMHSSSNAEGKSNFIISMIPSIKMISDKREKIPNFDDIIACYIDCIDKTFDKNSKPNESLDLIKIIFSKTPSKNTTYNKSVEKFSNFICSLNDSQIGMIFEQLKSITTTLVQADKQKHITKNCFEIYKKSVTDILKRESFDKKFLKEFRNALKLDEFAIITSVWALNPERLTDHQKEKMKEKKDHIAFYNDMMNNDSQSQDSASIKPWTPNKIVINKGKEQVIINSPKTNAEANVAHGNDGNEKIAETLVQNKSPFKKPKESPIQKSPQKKLKIPIESPQSNKNQSENLDISEKGSIEKSEKNSNKKEKDSDDSKNKSYKKLKPTKISKEEENLLKSMNIEVKDEKKKSIILYNLKHLQIDTVEGKNLMKSQFQSSEKGVRTRKSSNPKRISGQIKNKKINDDKETSKRNKKIRKSLNFEDREVDNKDKENKDRKLNKESDKNLLNRSNDQVKDEDEIMQPPKKLIAEKLQTSTTSLNSEDEIIESSQKSESILARRQRKSSINLTTALQDDNKKSNITKSPIKTQNTSPQGLDTEKSSVKNKSNRFEGKIRTRSASISPMAEDNNDKDKKLTSTEKLNSVSQAKKMSEMETELNTELLETEKSVLQSSIKVRTLRNNTSLEKISDPETQKENQNVNMLRQTKKSPEKIQKIVEIQNQVNTELRNNLLPEIEDFQKHDFPNKSPRKRLQYDLVEDNFSNRNAKLTRNLRKDLEADTSSTDSIIFPSLVQSPIDLEKKSRIDAGALEVSPKVQTLLNNVSNEESSRTTRSSPKKLSNIQKQQLIISEMETELNTEIVIDTEKTLTQKEVRMKSPRKLPHWAKKKVSEMDTEPNTEVLNTSIEHKTNASASPSTPKREGDIYQYMEDRTLQSPAYSPIKPLPNSTRKSLNQSITASPICKNTEEKNAEFMNDTLNISPIPTEEIEKDDKNTKNNSVTDKLFNNLKAENEKKSFEDNLQTSPPRKPTRSASLNSPPDRKNTNNSASPAPKPKVQSGLTGRGAQLINMIRNRKIDPINRFTSSPFRSSKQEELLSSYEHQLQQNPPSPPKKSNENNDVITSSPPVQPPQPVRDLLIFSKVLPSPHASPSASILKRKLRKESLDDFESPANKRKRVSFHDPPVSVTKEYVKHIEEDKQHTQTRLNKMLQERTSTPANNSMKHSLKRKNRIDSMIELARFNDSPIHYQSNIRMIEMPRRKSVESMDVANNDNDNDQDLPASPSNTTITKITTELQECDSSKHIITDESNNVGIPQTSVEMDSLKLNATADSTTNPKHISHHECNRINEDDEELRLVTPSPSIYFTDEAAVLQYVIEKYSFDEIYEKYTDKFENKEFLTNKLVRTIFKDLAIVMEKDVRIKTNVLEMLSEKHPKEFLDHAIQENLSSVVCDRLNTNSIIDYICETFKNNADSRKMILDKISNILTTDRFNLERHDYFMKLLHYEKMSSDDIINCIEIITKNRRL